MLETDFGFVNKGYGLSKIGPPRGGQSILGEYPGKQQFSESVAIPEFERDAARRC